MTLQTLFLSIFLSMSFTHAQILRIDYTKDVLNAIGQCNKEYFDASFRAFLETNPTKEEIKTLVHAAYAKNIEMTQKTANPGQRIKSIIWSAFWTWFWYSNMNALDEKFINDPALKANLFDVGFTFICVYGAISNGYSAGSKLFNLIHEPATIKQKQEIAYYMAHQVEQYNNIHSY